MKAFLVRGVPASIQQDGWWMDGVEPYEPRRRGPAHWRLAATGLGLILLTGLAALGGEGGFSPGAPSHSLAQDCNQGRRL